MASLPVLSLAEVNDLCLDQSSLSAISPVFYCHCRRIAETTLRKLQRCCIVTSRGLFYVIRRKETLHANTKVKKTNTGSLRLSVSNAVMLCHEEISFQFALQSSAEDQAVVHCDARVSRIGNPSFSLKMSRSSALRLMEVLHSFKEYNLRGLNVLEVDTIPQKSRWKRIAETVISGKSWKDQILTSKEATPLAELTTAEFDPDQSLNGPRHAPLHSDDVDQSLESILIEISVLEKVCDRLSDLKLQVAGGGAPPVHSARGIECERVQALLLSRLVCAVCEAVVKRSQLEESNEFEELFLHATKQPINYISGSL